ncbi:unnamed protein product [Brassica oleracea var. botrytis]|uniref:Uncharacterized protein n=1 Tax=Brassica oleracea TaxID=3712 RepID=A0A3P6FLY5_BRAOL|nr:unnamed protein product [Brassica oleracea]
MAEIDMVAGSWMLTRMGNKVINQIVLGYLLQFCGYHHLLWSLGPDESSCFSTWKQELEIP